MLYICWMGFLHIHVLKTFFANGEYRQDTIR